jgi:hypothetical protein
MSYLYIFLYAKIVVLYTPCRLWAVHALWVSCGSDVMTVAGAWVAQVEAQCWSGDGVMDMEINRAS